jgi:hypothetical protein
MFIIPHFLPRVISSRYAANLFPGKIIPLIFSNIVRVYSHQYRSRQQKSQNDRVLNPITKLLTIYSHSFNESTHILSGKSRIPEQAHRIRQFHSTCLVMATSTTQYFVVMFII